MNKNSSQGTLLILLAAILWGSTGTSQALAPVGANPLTIGALRLVIGGAALLLIALLRGKISGDSFRQPGVTLLAGVLVAAYQISFFAAVQTTGVAVGTMVAIGSSPLFAGLLTFVIDRQRPGRQWLIATLVAGVGLTVLFLPSSAEVSQIRTTGVLLALAAGASYAGYAMAIKHLLPGNSSETVIAIVFMVGGLLLAPFLFHARLQWLFEPRGAFVAIHLGLVTTALAYWLFARGLQSVPAVHAVTLSLAEPLTAAVLGIIVLGERLTLTTAVGMMSVLTGLVVLSYPVHRYNSAD